MDVELKYQNEEVKENMKFIGSCIGLANKFDFFIDQKPSIDKPWYKYESHNYAIVKENGDESRILIDVILSNDYEKIRIDIYGHNFSKEYMNTFMKMLFNTLDEFEKPTVPSSGNTDSFYEDLFVFSNVIGMFYNFINKDM